VSGESLPTAAAVSCSLVHAPGLVRNGSKPSRELARDAALGERLQAALRGYGDAVAYAPNQAFIGNITPESLWDRPQPWWSSPMPGAKAQGPYGEILGEDAFFGLLRLADDFDLVHLTPSMRERALAALRGHPLFGSRDLSKVGAEPATPGGGEDGLPLHDGAGAVVGRVGGGYDQDQSQTPDILLENLAAKASGTLALLHLLKQAGLDPLAVDYLLGCGEEAVGDRYQRGGGALAKAMAEMAGCTHSTGSDVKAFCCAPVHALVVAGALVRSGVYKNVVVVGGGSLAKLGMKMGGHLAKNLPIIEDCLGAMAVLVRAGKPGDPRIRLDAVGRHLVSSGGSAGQIYDALVTRPLTQLGLKIVDVDRYAVELHNPEITVPAASGDVPRTNYRTLGSLAVQRGEITKADLDAFVREHGMPGFAPTQGHIPAALPYLAHALPRLRDGSMKRAFFIAKGSLFLGKMTNLADGMSVMVDRPD